MTLQTKMRKSFFSDNIVSDLFGLEDAPLDYKPEQSDNFNQQFIKMEQTATLAPAKTLLNEPTGGIVLSQTLIDQIMNNDSTAVLEMLRNKIRSSAPAPAHVPETYPQQTFAQETLSYTQEPATYKSDIEQARPVLAEPRPVLKTESIMADKPAPKKGVKKRKYVKSGLFRKDKSGNFIYSSSDRARMSNTSDSCSQDEQPQWEQQTQANATGDNSSRVKRPLNGYNIFCKAHFDQVKAENPLLSINELSKLMGEKWKSMDAEQKKSYYDKVEVGQTRYKKPLNSYNLFCKMNFEALKKEFPQKSIHVLSKVIAERWKKLSDNEKKKYYEEAERQKQNGQVLQQPVQQEHSYQMQQQYYQQEMTSCQQQMMEPNENLDAFAGIEGFGFDIYNNL